MPGLLFGGNSQHGYSVERLLRAGRAVMPWLSRHIAAIGHPNPDPHRSLTDVDD